MKCEQCGKLIIGRPKYCPGCGWNLSERTEKKPIVTKESLQAGGQKIVAGGRMVKGFLKNVKDKVVEQLEKSESLDAQEIQPYLFRIAEEGVSVIDLLEDVLLHEDKDRFLKDVRGYYFTCMESEDTRRFNGGKLKPEKKYYLKNEDVIVLNDEVYVFSVMDQKDTEWNCCDADGTSFPDGLTFERSLAGEPGVIPQDDEEVYFNNNLLQKTAILNHGDCVLKDDRHYVRCGKKIFWQAPLEEHHHTCLSMYGTNIGAEDTLDINIRQRIADGPSGTKKVLLKDIQLNIRPGELVLILGGSGAGKTTFFNAVMGTEKADATILFGKENLYTSFDKVKHMIGYVPQFDLLRDNETVYMTLASAAQLKLPREFVNDQRLVNRRITEILNKLDLQKEKKTLVSKLSGGQRKRLSIGVEYISNPAVFFLDEPDSGLDGNQARKLMDTLRLIADDGKMVLVISHSPDRTSELFDKVVVLGKSEEDNAGRLAFYGSIEDALKFFEVDSIELIVRKIEEDPDTYINRFGGKE